MNKQYNNKINMILWDNKLNNRQNKLNRITHRVKIKNKYKYLKSYYKL